MIQLTRRGLLSAASDQDLECLRQNFQTQHYIQFKQFLHPELIALIQPFLDSAAFSPAQYASIGSELRMEPNIAADTLSFLSNDSDLFQFVQHVTQCNLIEAFLGRVSRLVPNPDHRFDWHDDLSDPSRLITMSINLSKNKFHGGVLQIRESRSRKIVSEVANTNLGGAVFFRISEEIEHRVTGLEAGESRTSFTGWFKSSIPGLFDAGSPPAGATS